MSPQFNPEKGQSLVEYGLVLVLIAVVIIGILAIFGDSVKQTYCRTTHALTPDADLSSACQAPIITPVASRNGNSLNLEAELYDPDGDPNNPYAAIDRVEFFIDNEASGPLLIERQYHFCLGGGNGDAGGCTAGYDISGLSSGRHTVIMVAYDNDGNVSRSRFRFTK